MTDLQTAVREAAVLAVLEKFCIPKEGRADAATHLKWLASVFVQNPDVYGEIAPQDAVDRYRGSDDGRYAVRGMLILSCDPKLQYDGVTAWEIAGKVLEALAQ